MYSSEDLERFYFQYQTEAVPHGVSLQSFCLTNNVLYNVFYKCHKDTRRKIVEVQVDGVPSVPTSESVPSSSLGAPPSQGGQSFSLCRTQRPEQCKGPRFFPVCSVELTLAMACISFKKIWIIRVCTV